MQVFKEFMKFKRNCKLALSLLTQNHADFLNWIYCISNKATEKDKEESWIGWGGGGRVIKLLTSIKPHHSQLHDILREIKLSEILAFKRNIAEIKQSPALIFFKFPFLLRIVTDPPKSSFNKPQDTFNVYPIPHCN